MRWSILLLVLLNAVIILSGYLLLNLNSNIVVFDFLLSEIQVSLGLLLLSSFLLGCFVFFVLEILYFSKRNKNE